MLKLGSFELVQLESVPFGWLVAFTLAIALFALIRPTMVRDYDNQPLPNNATARVIFVILYVLIYVALAVGLYLSGQTVAQFLPPLPYVKSVADQMTTGAPVVALVTLGTLWQVPFTKELERAFLVTLHSTRHLHNDILLLTQQLVGGVFDPPAAERSLNLNMLKKHGVFVRDDDPGPVHFFHQAEVRLKKGQPVDASESLKKAHQLGLTPAVVHPLEAKTLAELEAQPKPPTVVRSMSR